MNRSCWFFLCTLAAFATQLCHAADFAYAWPLKTEGDSAAWQVELTPEVYAAMTTADLRDVTVINAAGDAVPAAPYRPQATGAQDTLVSLPLFVLPATPAAPSNDDTIRLHIERGADGKLRRLDADGGGAITASAADLLLDASTVREPLAALLIEWDPADYATARFAISASDDLQQWRLLTGEATVLHLAQDGNVLDRHEIALDRGRHNYLRLRRLDAGPALPALAVRARLLAAQNAERPTLQWLTAVSDGVDASAEPSASGAGDASRAPAYRYHLPAALAISAAKLTLADDNSIARFAISSRSGRIDATAWETRADFVAFRLRQGEAVIDNDQIAMSGHTPARDWRVVAATPLAHAPALALAYTPDRLVFLAQGGGPYRLVAGSASARRGDYPIDTAIAQLRSSLARDWQPPLAVLGARSDLQGARALEAAPAAAPPRDWKTWFLWSVLVAAAALIGGLAISLVRKSNV